MMTRDLYCPQCAEQVTTGADGLCPWCETDLTAVPVSEAPAPEPFDPERLEHAPTHRPAPVKVRTAKAPRPGWDGAPTVARSEGQLTPTVPAAGPGTGKRSRLTPGMIAQARELLDGGASLRDAAAAVWLDPQAQARYSTYDGLYQALQRARARGWNLRAPKAGVYRGNLSEQTLHEAAWLYYYDQWGFQRIARWLRANRPQGVAGYASENALLNSIYHAFVKLGWPRRDRMEATNIASYRHGMAPRKGRNNTDYERWKKARPGASRPRCKGLVRGKKRYGARCGRPAKHGSDYCPAHDPAQREEVLTRVAAMRATSHAVVNIWPFTDWLVEQRTRFPTQRAFAEALGVDSSVVGLWLKGQGHNPTRRPVIKPVTVERALQALGQGPRLAELYPEITTGPSGPEGTHS
jgi:hypothetical protein